MAEVTLSLEEYLALLEKNEGWEPRRMRARKNDPLGKKKRVGKKDPKMARALRKANAWGRTKSGKMRKGVTQGKIMKKAHQLRRKM